MVDYLSVSTPSLKLFNVVLPPQGEYLYYCGSNPPEPLEVEDLTQAPGGTTIYEGDRLRYIVYIRIS